MADNPTNVPPATGPGSPFRISAGLAAAIALVSFSCFHFPMTTLRPGVDPSWMIVLHYAREHGWHLGRDIISLYGPWGFLAQEWFHPHAAGLRIFFEIAVGCAIATGLCLVAWQMKTAWRLLLIGYFVLVASPWHPGGDALFIDVGLFCWGLLCFLECGPGVGKSAIILALLAAAGALVKNTTLVTGLLTVGLAAVALAGRGRRGLALGAVAAFAGFYLLAWLSLGEPLSGLWSLLLTVSQLTSGYNEAAGVSFINLSLILLMVAGAAGAVVIRGWCAAPMAWRKPVPQRAIFVLWLAGMVFEGWKYGSVRSDPIHLALACGYVPVAALCVEAIPTPNRLAIISSRACALLSLFTSLLVLSAYVSEILVSRRQILYEARCNFLVLTQPGRYLREQTEKLQVSAQRHQLPHFRKIAGRSTVDLFGQEQILPIFNELNYHPRPNYQNIVAYTRPTMEINDRFYCSTNAPDYVIFNLEPIDDRFPPLEDAWVLRDLLENYGMAGQEDQNLLLRRKKIEPTRLILVKEGGARPGDKIGIDGMRGTGLWMEIDLQPTLWGRLESFLYKTPTSELTVWSQNGREPQHAKTFHAPASMLSAGFLINPLILDNNDVVDFYAGGQARAAQALSVETSGGWRDEIHFRLYRIESGP